MAALAALAVTRKYIFHIETVHCSRNPEEAKSVFRYLKFFVGTLGKLTISNNNDNKVENM